MFLLPKCSPRVKCQYLISFSKISLNMKCHFRSKRLLFNERMFQDTMAGIPSELGASGDKQDVAKIYGALHSCISKIPKDQLRRVVHIAVCGQMHGVMFWKKGEGWIRNAKDQVVVSPAISALYTWQDGRCSPEFLNSLPYPTSHLSLNTGYGCATIFWHLQNKPEYLMKFDR